MKQFTVIILMCIALISAAVEVTAQSTPPKGLLGTLREIEPHLYIFQGADGYYVNSLVLEDTDGLIIVDTQFEDQNNKAMVSEIKRVFPDKKLKTIVITHAHLDHFIGIKFFQDAFGKCEIIGLKGENEHMKKTAKDFWPTYLKLSKEHGLTQDDIVFPTKEIDQAFELSFSGRIMEFSISGPNESWQSMVAYVPDTRTIFLADMFWGGLVISPEIGATLNGWSRELNKALEKDISRVIAGHGWTMHYTLYETEDFARKLVAMIAESREVIENGMSREAFVAHNFKTKLDWFGDREDSLKNIFDEISLELNKTSGTN